MVTTQELKMVSRESNEINGEKLFCVRQLRKKSFPFDKVWKKCMFKLGVQKSLITKNHRPPTYQMVRPLLEIKRVKFNKDIFGYS